MLFYLWIIATLLILPIIALRPVWQAVILNYICDKDDDDPPMFIGS